MKPAIVELSVAVGLVGGIIATGVTLVATKHESRLLFQELELLKSEEDRLQDEWSALRLEVHTLGSHSRIDEIARGRLGMIEPGEQLEYVELSR